MNKKVLVVAAHPDDEILGCGGTIMNHIASKDTVNVFIVAEGVTSRNAIIGGVASQNEVFELRKTAERVSKMMGVTNIEFGELPDNRLDQLPLIEVVKILEAQVERYKPDVIYTHHGGDLNIDHRLVHEAVMTASRPQPGCGIGKILFFETPSSTEWRSQAGNHFQPNWYSDISRVLEKKIEVLALYESEMRPWPHARSIRSVEAMARYRGATVGLDAVEAFMLGRVIQLFRDD